MRIVFLVCCLVSAALAQEPGARVSEQLADCQLRLRGVRDRLQAFALDADSLRVLQEEPGSARSWWARCASRRSGSSSRSGRT